MSVKYVARRRSSQFRTPKELIETDGITLKPINGKDIFIFDDSAKEYIVATNYNSSTGGCTVNNVEYHSFSALTNDNFYPISNVRNTYELENMTSFKAAETAFNADKYYVNNNSIVNEDSFHNLGNICSVTEPSSITVYSLKEATLNEEGTRFLSSNNDCIVKTSISDSSPFIYYPDLASCYTEWSINPVIMLAKSYILNSESTFDEVQLQTIGSKYKYNDEQYSKKELGELGGLISDTTPTSVTVYGLNEFNGQTSTRYTGSNNDCMVPYEIQDIMIEANVNGTMPFHYELDNSHTFILTVDYTDDFNILADRIDVYLDDNTEVENYYAYANPSFSADSNGKYTINVVLELYKNTYTEEQAETTVNKIAKIKFRKAKSASSIWVIPNESLPNTPTYLIDPFTEEYVDYSLVAALLQNCDKVALYKYEMSLTQPPVFYDTYAKLNFEDFEGKTKVSYDRDIDVTDSTSMLVILPLYDYTKKITGLSADIGACKSSDNWGSSTYFVYFLMKDGDYILDEAFYKVVNIYDIHGNEYNYIGAEVYQEYSPEDEPLLCIGIETNSTEPPGTVIYHRHEEPFVTNGWCLNRTIIPKDTPCYIYSWYNADEQQTEFPGNEISGARFMKYYDNMEYHVSDARAYLSSYYDEVDYTEYLSVVNVNGKLAVVSSIDIDLNGAKRTLVFNVVSNVKEPVTCKYYTSISESETDWSTTEPT